MTPLRQHMSEDMQLRHFSPRTQEAYLAAVTRFAQHFGRSPAQLGLDHIRQYHLSRNRTEGVREIVVAAV